MILLEEVGSTNTYVKEHFGEIPDGTLVSARCQTAGRGRLGRKWLAKKDCDITASIALKKLEDGFHAGVISGLAVLRLVRECVPGALSFLKWPNDVYIREKKVCGILSEGIVSGGRLQGVVCGMGVNVNSTESDLSGAGQPATSLAIEAGREFNVKILTEKLEKYLQECYINFNLDFSAVLHEWKRENRLTGEVIEAVSPAGTRFTGVFREIDASGAMVLECEDGIRIFSCGDVKIDVARTDWEKMRRSIYGGGAVCECALNGNV